MINNNNNKQQQDPLSKYRQCYQEPLAAYYKKQVLLNST